MAEIFELSFDELFKEMKDGLPDPVKYQYYKNLAKRRIIVNSEIDDDLLEYAILPLEEMINDGSNEPIEILLSTCGGEIYSGFALVDMIEKSSCPITIRINSIAASMGALIAMAGRNNPNVKTVCQEFSVGLIHGGSTYMEGNIHSVKDTFDFSQHYEEKIKKYILSHTNITEDLYEKIERKEYWMDADEMLRLGVVDEII